MSVASQERRAAASRMAPRSSLARGMCRSGSRPLRFFDPTPRDSLISVGGNGDAAITMQKAFVIVVWGVLAVAAIVLLIRKLVLATPRARRTLALGP